MTRTDDDSRPRGDSLSGAARRSKSPRRRQKLWLRTGVGAAILALLTAAGAGLLAHQASTVRDQLQQAMDLVPQLQSQLEEDDSPTAERTFAQIQERTSEARSTTSGPLWKAASAVPIVGPNFKAVSEVSVSADDVVARAVSPLLKQYGSLNWQALSPTDGQVDVQQLQEAAPSITTAANTVRLSYERMASIDLSRLIPQVADPVRAATEQLRGASGALDTASSAAQLLPAMLGADGPRNYLVLVQNSAEVRATGGIPGALATLRTDNGRITMGEQSSASAIGAFTPSFEVDPAQEAIYTARLGRQMQNVNLTPDFPTAAATAKKMWQERFNGQQVDGVIALDPVVLAHLLGATGPVELDDPQVLQLIDGTNLPTSLTQENVAATLLSDVYREIDAPAAQDAYFAAIAARVFGAFTDGQGDGAKLIEAVTTSVQEDRLYLWSDHRSEQDIVATTGLAGSVTGPNVGGATFGLYFNDGTGAKMDYHVKRTAELLQQCQDNGYSRYTIRISISNTAPLDAATSLPAYVTGGGIYGVPAGHVRTNYVAYGPAQALTGTATRDGEPVPIAAYRHGQRPVGVVSVELAPGESTVVEMSFSNVVQSSAPELHMTPTLTNTIDAVSPASVDASCG